MCTTFTVWDSSQQSENNGKAKLVPTGDIFGHGRHKYEASLYGCFHREKNWTLTEDACRWKSSHYKINYKGSKLLKPGKRNLHPQEQGNLGQAEQDLVGKGGKTFREGEPCATWQHSAQADRQHSLQTWPRTPNYAFPSILKLVLRKQSI